MAYHISHSFASCFCEMVICLIIPPSCVFTLLKTLHLLVLWLLQCESLTTTEAKTSSHTENPNFTQQATLSISIMNDTYSHRTGQSQFPNWTMEVEEGYQSAHQKKRKCRFPYGIVGDDESSPSPGKYFSVDTTVQDKILDGTTFVDASVVQDTVADKELWAQADNEDNEDAECWSKTRQMPSDLLVGTTGQRKFLPAVRWGKVNAKAIAVNAITPGPREADPFKNVKNLLHFTGSHPRNLTEEEW